MKYLFFGGLCVFLFTLLTVWIVFEKRNVWLLNELQSHVNRSQSGQLKIESIHLKLFRYFPDVTIQLNGITYYEHPDTLRKPEEKPILQAKRLFVAVDLLSLLRDELNISRIRLSDADVTIMEYQGGDLNLDRALAKPVKQKSAAVKKVMPTPPKQTQKTSPTKTKPVITQQPKQNVQIDLKIIELDGVTLNWHSFQYRKTSSLTIQEMDTELTNTGDSVSINLSSSTTIQRLYVNGTSIPGGNLVIHTTLSLERKNKRLAIHSGEISYNDYTLSMQGSYEHLNNRKLDLEIDASTNDLKMVASILRPGFVKNDTDLQGDIYAKGRIFGALHHQPLLFDFSFGVRDLNLTLPNDLGEFENVGFEGRFKSGNATDYSKGLFEVGNIHGHLPGGAIHGSVRVNNFKEPHLTYRLNAQLKLDGFDKVFRIDQVKDLTGSVSIRANFEGPLKSIATHEMDSSRSSSVTMENVSFTVSKTNQDVKKLNGKMTTRNNQSIIENLSLQYGHNDLQVNATVDNLAYLLFNLEKEVTASGKLQSNQLHTKDFIPDTLMTAQVQDRISNFSTDFVIKSIVSKQSDTLTKPEIFFQFKNLSAKLDQLPDLKSINTQGKLMQTDKGLSLKLESFQAIFPQGVANVNGDLLVPSKRFWNFNAHVKLHQFPWTYIRELTAEIKETQEPTAKNLHVKDMELVTAELDISSSLITYPFDITKTEIKNAHIEYLLPGSKLISIEKLEVSLDKLLFKHPENSGYITGLNSTNGKVAIKQLKLPGMNKFDISMNINGSNDLLNISFLSEIQKATSERGTLNIDFSKEEPAYKLTYLVEDANMEHFIKKYYHRKLMKGNVDYTIDLQTSGWNWADVQQNIQCDFEISGESLRFYGVDIDNALKKYERSQHFNLTDLGAVLVAGPVGLVATKGTDFAALAGIKLDSSKFTNIETLYTRWTYKNSSLKTEDVAFATTKNRIAFDGSINFQRDTIPGITIAVVDKNGCSLMDQKLYGKVGAVKTGKLNITKTLLGSVINFVNAVVGVDCKPVYNGKVKASQSQ